MPSLAVFAGDPVGIGPELVARVIAAPESLPPAQIHVLAQRASLEAGAAAAGLTLDYEAMASRDYRGSVHILPWPGWDLPPFAPGEADAANGAFVMAGLRVAFEHLRGIRNKIDALCFAPINRAALRAAGMTQQDEVHWCADVLEHDGPCGELYVLDKLWTSRLTSRVPLASVAELLTAGKVADSITMLGDALYRAGVLTPRIGVCSLNPHVGDNGKFGREETEIIEPGIRLASSPKYIIEGPLPADTVFVRARSGGFDGVVAMYHDQGQIAMNLLGFERGVTVFAGLPQAVTTPAHGTAYDIAGKGIANPWALRNAMAIALRIASQ